MDMAVDSSGSAYVVFINNGRPYLKEPQTLGIGRDVLAELVAAGFNLPAGLAIVDVACAFLPGGLLQMRGVDAGGAHYVVNFDTTQSGPGGAPWSGANTVQ
jgi:hypothetical protein